MIRRVPRISERARLARRKQLLDAAWQGLRKRGYRDLTVDDVCDTAGVSKGTFYGYFESKNDLLVALIEEESAALDEVVSGLCEADLTGAERLRLFARAILKQAEDPARAQVRADLWASLVADSALHDHFRATVGRRRRLLRAWIERSIEDGDLAIEEGYANALASVLLALSDGLTLHHSLDPNGFRWPNIRVVLDLLLSGIDAAGGPAAAGRPGAELPAGGRSP
jgi:AcrR family transcriptional regulator